MLSVSLGACGATHSENTHIGGYDNQLCSALKDNKEAEETTQEIGPVSGSMAPDTARDPTPMLAAAA